MSLECALMREYGDCFRKASRDLLAPALELSGNEYRLNKVFENSVLIFAANALTEFEVACILKSLSRKKIRNIEAGVVCELKTMNFRIVLLALPPILGAVQIYLLKNFSDRFRINFTDAIVDKIALTHIHEQGPVCRPEYYPSFLETLSSHVVLNFNQNLFYTRMRGVVQVICSTLLIGATLYSAMNARKLSANAKFLMALVFLSNCMVILLGLFDYYKGTIHQNFADYKNQVQGCVEEIK